MKCHCCIGHPVKCQLYRSGSEMFCIVYIELLMVRLNLFKPGVPFMGHRQTE